MKRLQELADIFIKDGLNTKDFEKILKENNWVNGGLIDDEIARDYRRREVLVYNEDYDTFEVQNLVVAESSINEIKAMETLEIEGLHYINEDDVRLTPDYLFFISAPLVREDRNFLASVYTRSNCTLYPVLDKYGQNFKLANVSRVCAEYNGKEITNFTPSIENTNYNKYYEY